MFGGRGVLCGWLSLVHYRIERKKLRYPMTPALGRLLVTTSIVCSRLSPDVLQDIRKLEALTGITLKSFVLNKVTSPLAAPGASAANPIELVETDTTMVDSTAQSLVGTASSSDCLVAKNRTVRRRGKAQVVMSSSVSRSSARDPPCGVGSSEFSSPRIGVAATGCARGELMHILDVIAGEGPSTVVPVVAGDVAAASMGAVDGGGWGPFPPIPLVPYPETSESDASIEYRPARLGALQITSPIGSGIVSKLEH
ncbi:hypothetical protein M758_UG238700 [Ceratodon purpureus]|nr:hypothetical protein M758_UG238700 [Ceratodon purpureus]